MYIYAQNIQLPVFKNCEKKMTSVDANQYLSPFFLFRKSCNLHFKNYFIREECKGVRERKACEQLG